MENNWENWNSRDDWNNQYDRRRDNDRNRFEDMPQDPDTYRGAYRLDTSSNHRNFSTYDGFGSMRHPDDRRNFPDERHIDRQENRDNYNTSRYNQDYRNDMRGNDMRNDRFGNSYNQDWNEQETPSWRDYMDHDDWGRGNFYNDYGPDHYPHRRGENTGNMAGSLSFGYDGDNVSNPDFDRRFNPLTGEIRHPQDRHRRHVGKNPSSYRLYDLSKDRRR